MYAMKAWPNSWMQSEVIQPPTTSRTLSGSVNPGAMPVQRPTPPTTAAPTGIANTGLTRTAPASDGSGRRRASEPYKAEALGEVGEAIEYFRIAAEDIKRLETN